MQPAWWLDDFISHLGTQPAASTLTFTGWQAALAAFAQFASDLDKATRDQLTRGEKLSEITKQPQYQPLPVEKQVAILYVATTGKVDDVPTPRVREFETQFYRFLETDEFRRRVAVARFDRAHDRVMFGDRRLRPAFDGQRRGREQRRCIEREVRDAAERVGAAVAAGVAATGAATAAAEKDRALEHVANVSANPESIRHANGLIVEPLKSGAGDMPSSTDHVSVHYVGRLVDGTVFDSSVERGEPATFPLNRVIPCWTEGLQNMHVGAKATLVCPPDTAYGDRGSPPTIPPAAVLKFEVELLEIQAAPEPAEEPAS